MMVYFNFRVGLFCLFVIIVLFVFDFVYYMNFNGYLILCSKFIVSFRKFGKEGID